MDFELHPTIALRSGPFNALLAPTGIFIHALNDEGPRAEAKIAAKASPRAQKSQIALEVFS
ncbi:MAG: hypothetical protein ACE14P_05550 [Methanotrichaceae archaeon]